MITIVAANEDDVLCSHFLENQFLTLLMWGKQEKEETYEEWRGRQSEEKIKKFLEKGFAKSTLKILGGERISVSDLINDSING